MSPPPRRLSRNHVVGSLPARPGHSRDTPVMEITCTYSRRLGEVAATRGEFFNGTGWAFYVKWRCQCGCQMPPDFRGVISYKPAPSSIGVFLVDRAARSRFPTNLSLPLYLRGWLASLIDYSHQSDSDLHVDGTRRFSGSCLGSSRCKKP